MKKRKSRASTHRLVRPPKGVLASRLGGNGRWSVDDGRPAEAFYDIDGNVYVADCDCAWGDLKCPRRRAADRVNDKLDIGATIVTRKPTR